MRLNIDDLNNWKNTDVKLPEYDILKIKENTNKNPKWVHFGAGNIFRIFIGGIADELISKGVSDTGIVCVESFDTEVIEKIYKPYDNLVLSVTLNADGSTDKKILASLTESITIENIDRLKEIFLNKSLQIVSFTITEKGYGLKNLSGDYLPNILKDINSGPDNCSSAMSVVTAMLYERYMANCLPVTLVSMDNCSHNGDKLKNAVITIAKEWLSRKYVDMYFIEYLENEVSFPWTMIDKITPRPSEKIADSLKDMGAEHMDIVITNKNTYIAPFVNAERPGYLVIEDDFKNGRPELEKAGVYMTNRDTVNKVEKMKVNTCLNPLHTALAVYGCLLDYKLIADEMKDKELVKLVEGIGKKEGMPVVTNPVIISPDEFLNEVLTERIPNPFMPDSPQRIATDTSQKVGVRYGETIKAYKNAEKLNYIPLAIAGWCRYLLGIDDDGEKFQLSPDPMLDELTENLKGIEIGNPSSYKGQLKSILSNENIFGINLYSANLGDKIEEMFKELISEKGAVRKTLIKHT